VPVNNFTCSALTVMPPGCGTRSLTTTVATSGMTMVWLTVGLTIVRPATRRFATVVEPVAVTTPAVSSTAFALASTASAVTRPPSRLSPVVLALASAVRRP
jgi:hypothetical protein